MPKSIIECLNSETVEQSEKVELWNQVVHCLKVCSGFMVNTFDKDLLGMNHGGQGNHDNNSRSASSWTHITYDGKGFLTFSSGVYDESSDGYIEHGTEHSASFSEDKE